MANEIIIVSVGILLSMSVFFCLELLHREKKYSPELLRRVAHVVSSVIASIFSLLLSPPFFIGALCFFLLFIAVSHKKRVFNHIHKVARSTIGEELLPLGFIVSYLIAGGHQYIYIPAFLIVGFADPITGIIMEKYKNHMIGILIFFFITLFILSFFNISIVYIIIVASVTALVERVSGYGTDNLTIPLTVALLLRIL